MKIKGANNIEKLGMGILAGGIFLGVGLGISASILAPSMGLNTLVTGLLTASGAAAVLGTGIGFTFLFKASQLEEKDIDAFWRFRTLLSKGENL